MTGDALFNQQLIVAITQNEPDFELIKNIVITAYNTENQSRFSLGASLSKAEQIKIVQWLNRSTEHPMAHLLFSRNLLTSLFLKEKPVKTPFFSADLSSKVSTLAQFHCPVCHAEDQFPIMVIPLKISPESKQALSKVKGLRKAFENAIAQAFSEKEIAFKRGEKLCVLVVFVLGSITKDKDLDNMSKALMDALQGNLFEHDADIEHLNLFKIKHNMEDSFIYLNIRRTDLNEHNDVLFKDFFHTMLVKDISQFYEKEKGLLGRIFKRKPKQG